MLIPKQIQNSKFQTFKKVFGSGFWSLDIV